MQVQVSALRNGGDHHLARDGPQDDMGRRESSWKGDLASFGGPALAEVLPSRVDRLDESHLLPAHPSLEFLFTLDCGADICGLLEIHEPPDVVSLGETAPDAQPCAPTFASQCRW